MKHQQSERSLVTLGNAGELVNNIVQGVIGNEVADTFNGTPLSREVIYDSALTQFQQTAAVHLKKA